MFKNLEKFFKSDDSGTEDKPDLEIAAAALFLEMASADFEVLDEEKEQIEQTLANFFDLEINKIDDLIAEASSLRKSRNDLWYFTNAVRKELDREQKKKMLEDLWMIIYADGRVDKFEDVLIRKMTTLLGLEHGEMITAKLKAKEKTA